MRYGGSLTGEGSALKDKFAIGSSVSAGQIVCRGVPTATTTAPLSGVGGVIVNPSKVLCTDVWGLTEEAGTMSTTKGSAGVEVEVVYNPFAIYDAVVTGGTGDDEDTALTINEQDTADTNGLIIDDADLSSDSMVGGLLYALTGNNATQSRIITSFTSGDSCGTLSPFDNTIASGDQFLVFGFSRAIIGLSLSTSFTQVPQWQPCSAVGVDFAEAVTIDVIVDDYDVAAPTARCRFVVRDHILNPS